MKKILYMLPFAFFVNYSNPANSQSVPPPTPQNTANVNVTGNYQNIYVNQSGTGNHTANITTFGNQVPVSVTQSGSTNKDITINIYCVSMCADSPTVVNQY